MVFYRCPVCGDQHSGTLDFHFCSVCNTPVTAFVYDAKAEYFGSWDTNTRRMIRAMADPDFLSEQEKTDSITFLSLQEQKDKNNQRSRTVFMIYS